MSDEIFSSEDPIYIYIYSHHLAHTRSFQAKRSLISLIVYGRNVHVLLKCCGDAPLAVRNRGFRHMATVQTVRSSAAQWSCVSCHLHMRKQPFLYILNSWCIAIAMSLQFQHIDIITYIFLILQNTLREIADNKLPNKR